MNSTAAYIKRLKDSAICQGDAWDLVNISNQNEEYERIKIEKSLEILGHHYELDPDKNRELAGYFEVANSGNFGELIARLADGLNEDIDQCTLGAHTEKLSKSIFSIFPIGLVDAFCLNQDEFGEKLDGYAVFINQGLYFGLSMLAKAFVVESFDGDLIQYKRSGGHEYKCAIKLFIKPSRDDLNEVFFSDLAPDTHGEVSAYQSSVSMIVLLFVALHEFGHIVHDDFDLMGAYKFHVSSSEFSGKEYVGNEKNTHWDAEFKADEFALKSICNRAKNQLSAWANFVSIYLFFSWLSDVEKIMGKPLCPFHPPPAERAKRLELILESIVGRSDYGYSYLRWVDARRTHWISGIEEYL